MITKARTGSTPARVVSQAPPPQSIYLFIIYYYTFHYCFLLILIYELTEPFKSGLLEDDELLNVIALGKRESWRPNIKAKSCKLTWLDANSKMDVLSRVKQLEFI